MADRRISNDLAEAYAARTAALRDATKWLLTSAAAVGGLLVAGLQLTSLGSLGLDSLPRLVAAALGLVVALVAVGYMVWAAGALLSEEWTTLAELHLENFQNKLDGPPRDRSEKRRRQTLDQIRQELAASTDEIFGSVAADIHELSSRLADANAKARSGDAGVVVAPLLDAANAVVQFANFERTRARFKWLRRRLAFASAATAAGVVLYAYAANPPPDSVLDLPAGRSTPPVSSATGTGGRPLTGHSTGAVTTAPRDTTVPPPMSGQAR